jgi:hypothetical protein
MHGLAPRIIESAGEPENLRRHTIWSPGWYLPLNQARNPYDSFIVSFTLLFRASPTRKAEEPTKVREGSMLGLFFEAKRGSIPRSEPVGS